MKYRDPETGEFKEIYVKAADTLPVGSVVDYDGEEIPAGWEQIEEELLIESGSTENGRWAKFSDGTIIQRGTATIPKNEEKVTVNFPIPFVRTSYQINTSIWYQRARVVTIAWSDKKINSFTAFPTFLDWETKDWTTTLEYDQDFDWIAIGKWK